MKRRTKTHPIRIILGLAVAIGVPTLMYLGQLSRDIPYSTADMLTALVAAFFSCAFGAGIAFANVSNVSNVSGRDPFERTAWGDDRDRFGGPSAQNGPDWTETNQTSSVNYYYNHHGRLDQY